MDIYERKKIRWINFYFIHNHIFKTLLKEFESNQGLLDDAKVATSEQISKTLIAADFRKL